MSDHTIVIIRVVKLFSVQFFCVFFPPLLNISASVRSLPFLSFIEPMFVWNVPLVSLIFLKRSLVFHILLFASISCIDCWERLSYLFLLYLWKSVSRCLYLSFSPLLFTSLLFTAICKASSDSHFAFVHFFSWRWSWVLSPVQCHEPPSTVHQALCIIISSQYAVH